MCEQCEYAALVLQGRVLKAVVEDGGIILFYEGGRRVLLEPFQDTIVVSEHDIPIC
jgi:hypothetical protein